MNGGNEARTTQTPAAIGGQYGTAMKKKRMTEVVLDKVKARKQRLKIDDNLWFVVAEQFSELCCILLFSPSLILPLLFLKIINL